MGELLALLSPKSTRTVAPVRVLVSIAVWIGLAPAPSSAEVMQHTTPAGHLFHYVQMPEADRTAIVIDWESAWVHRAEHPTAAHIGAMLMASGGTGGDLETMISQSNEIGSHAELNATADGARGLLVAPEGGLEQAAALARDALTGPRLDATPFESIRARLSRSVRAAEAPEQALVWDAARRFLLGDAPLHDFLRLPVDDIEGATLSEARAWRRAVFAQANATVAAAGSAPAANVAAAVDTLLEGLPEMPCRRACGRTAAGVRWQDRPNRGARRGALGDRCLRTVAVGWRPRERGQCARAGGARPTSRPKAAPGARRRLRHLASDRRTIPATCAC